MTVGRPGGDLPSPMAARALTTLVTGLFDYAGLFPPASLEMSAAAERFEKARMARESFMLGRMVCAASKLHKLSEAASVMMPGTAGTSGYREHADILEPWSVTAVIDRPLEEAFELIGAFDEHHAVEVHGLARVESIELKAKSPGFIDEALEAIPDDVTPFFEVPPAEDCRGFIAALAGNEACAKIRCGGVTPDAIPSAERIADFLIACRGAGVPFKATAGLHHPVRGERPLTYESEPPRAVMHGFLNVWMAAAMARIDDAARGELVGVLEETDADAFAFTDTEARWKGHTIDVADLARVREKFAISIGSCSFDEPVDDLKQLGLLD